MPLSAIRFGWIFVLLGIVLVGLPNAAQELRTVNVSQQPDPETRTTIIYTATDEAIPNPERGFHRYIETRASEPTPYSADLLAGYYKDGFRLLYCINYLDTFVQSEISADFLAHVRSNLDQVRAAGLKCILRFAYTDDDPTQRNEEPPFGDATLAQIQAHIAQLTPILHDHADVIAYVQAGFIGVWGEWYYTDHFVDDPAKPWIISDAQYARRLQMLTALLDALPVTRTVSIRYPFGKQAMLGNTDPINEDEAHTGSLSARIGFHNDCFLASDTDFGTYRDGQLEADKEYLALSTRYLPLGGESCAPNPPRSDCPTALAELERFHWSYLNWDYNPTVLASWQSGNCLDEIRQRLGYRLVLKQGIYPNLSQPGGSLPILIELENQGFAAPVNPRPVELLLFQSQSGTLYTLPLAVDPRRWLPGLHRIEQTITLPADLPVGDYKLLLRLPDPTASLAARPAYALRFANAATWDAEMGANHLLHTISIHETLPGSTLYLPSLRR
ncbi:MAG: DUF4832 domain-containing protein [Caldilineaceae bacterium]|nr:DUF4832 domain-containing protein [Caldilineaceae bacterium]